MLWLKSKSKYFKLAVFIELYSGSFRYLWYSWNSWNWFGRINPFKFTLKIRSDVELVDILKAKFWIFCLLRVSQYIFKRFFLKVLGIHNKNVSFVAQTKLNFHSLHFEIYIFFFSFARIFHGVSVLSKSFCGRLLWFETSALKQKSRKEIQREYIEAAQELLKQSRQVDSPWFLSAYLLSVHRMASVKPCFSALSYHLVDLLGGHRLLPRPLSAGIPAFISQLGNYSSQQQFECTGKKNLPCRFWTVRTSNSACDTYLFACFKKRKKMRMTFYELL